MVVYGYDVLEIEPNADQDRASTYARTLTVFDNRTGKLYVNDRSGVAIVRPQGFSWVMHGRAEIDAFRQWLAARKGACVPFWMPSWQHDLVMAEDVVPGVAGLQAQKTGYAKYQYPQASRRYLCFTILDGTGAKYYRKVIAADESANRETLTLDSAPDALIPAEHCMVSFLMLVRLSTDDPELVWHSRDVAEVVLDFVELPKEVPA